jgi:hypothetical protein
VSSAHEATSRALLIYDPQTGRILQRVREVTYGNGQSSSEAELREIAETLSAAKGLNVSALPSLFITDPQLGSHRYRVDVSTKTLVAEDGS